MSKKKTALNKIKKMFIQSGTTKLPEAAKYDLEAPSMLIFEIGTGKDFWGIIEATPMQFKTGSVGYNASGKIENSKSGETYQLSANIVLLGSKPEKEMEKKK